MDTCLQNYWYPSLNCCRISAQVKQEVCLCLLWALPHLHQQQPLPGAHTSTPFPPLRRASLSPSCFHAATRLLHQLSTEFLIAFPLTQKVPDAGTIRSTGEESTGHSAISASYLEPGKARANTRSSRGSLRLCSAHPHGASERFVPPLQPARPRSARSWGQGSAEGRAEPRPEPPRGNALSRAAKGPSTR